MAFAALSCGACGARQVVRHGTRFRCEYCQGEVVPRLVPGPLCTESVDAALCGRTAESVCRGCARPMCRRHAVPRSLYWQQPLEELGTDSERSAWDRCGQEIRERLGALERLASGLHRE